MSKKADFELIIGGEFTTQPKHKPNAIPKDYLAYFRNVNPSDPKEIVDFANSFEFSGYIVPDLEKSFEEKFAKIHCRYAKIIDELLRDDRIKYRNLAVINEDLDKTHPKIVLRKNANDLLKIDNGFAVCTMRSDGIEKAITEVISIGSFEKDKFDKNQTRIQVKISRPANSKEKWHYDHVKDGIQQVEKLFPSDKWNINRRAMQFLVLTDGKLSLDSKLMPISIEMNFRVGKSIFNRLELSSVWSPVDGKSLIAKRVWDYINTGQKKDKFKICKICGDYHRGKSENYCNKIECSKEWDARRKNPIKHKMK